MQKIYKNIYNAVYTLHAKYGRVPVKQRDDNYWKCLLADIEECSHIHTDTFTSELLVAMVSELERQG